MKVTGHSVDADFRMKVRQAIKAAHERLIAADLATPEIRAYLNAVPVIPSNRMTSSAGTASTRKHQIKLNARLLEEHPDQLQETLMHEIAHLLNTKFFGGDGHDDKWKGLMVRLGYEPRRCHGMAQQKPTTVWLAERGNSSLPVL